MRPIIDSALRPRHVDPWRMRTCIAFVAVNACLFWAAIYIAIGG